MFKGPGQNKTWGGTNMQSFFGQMPPAMQQMMMQQMMQQMQKNWGGGMAGGMAASGGVPANDMQWKQHFHEACSKKGIEEKPTYDSTDVAGKNGAYLGTCTLQGETYSAEKPSVGKRQAEQAAARAAMKALFPEEFAIASRGIPVSKKAGMGPMMGAAPAMQAKGKSETPPEKKVWIGNLPEGITPQELQAHFNQVGTVTHAESWKKSGMITFNSAEEATHAIASLNGSELKGSAIQVDVWTQKEKKSSANQPWGGQFPFPMMGMPGVGQKRKHEPDENLKGKLSGAINIYIMKRYSRNMTKTDIQYDVQELEGETKTYQATVRIAEYEGGNTFAGEVCDSKKAAEESAAKIAYDMLKDVLVPMIAEHQAAKKAKAQAETAEWKKRMEEKTAAKATGALN